MLGPIDGPVGRQQIFALATTGESGEDNVCRHHGVLYGLQDGGP
jgi:hypothetical protein